MTKGINLDALIGETTPFPLTYKGQEFGLPAELPGAALAPFLAEDLGLIDLISDVLDADKGADEDWTDLALRVLKARPKLPVELLTAAKESLAALLEEQADAFFGLNPSVNAYWLIARNLGGLYGFGAADFFGSAGSSEGETGGGENSKATSSSTSTPTPEVSGDVLVIPASSEHAASSS